MLILGFVESDRKVNYSFIDPEKERTHVFYFSPSEEWLIMKMYEVKLPKSKKGNRAVINKHTECIIAQFIGCS